MYSAGQKITSVAVRVDGFSAPGTLRIGVARPDVCASLPNADACPNIGFTLTLDTKLLSNGPHILGVRAVNDRGDYAVFPSLVNGGINVFVKN